MAMASSGPGSQFPSRNPGTPAKSRLLLVTNGTSRSSPADCVHLRSFRTEYGNKARAGLLLHTGSSIEWLAPDVLAAPWWRVL